MSLTLQCFWQFTCICWFVIWVAWENFENEWTNRRNCCLKCPSHPEYFLQTFFLAILNIRKTRNQNENMWQLKQLAKQQFWYLLYCTWYVLYWGNTTNIYNTNGYYTCINLSDFECIKYCGWCIAEGLERRTLWMGVMSLNPEACTWSGDRTLVRKGGFLVVERVLRPYRWPRHYWA